MVQFHFMIMFIKVIVILGIVGVFLIIYGLLRNKCFITKAHEIGHAKTIESLENYNTSQYLTYIMLYRNPNQFGCLGKAISFVFSKLIENKDYTSIKKIARAGKDAEYKMIESTFFLSKLIMIIYKLFREIYFLSERFNKNADGYYYRYSEKFNYKSIHDFILENKELFFNPESKAELYLYTKNQLKKIKYKNDLPELSDTGYKFDFIRNEESSFL